MRSRSGIAGTGLVLASSSAIGPELPQTKTRFCITCAGSAHLITQCCADRLRHIEDAGNAHRLPRHMCSQLSCTLSNPAGHMPYNWTQLAQQMASLS